jgi:hypothetical protein
MIEPPNLNDVIELVAREMTGGEPRALRGAVLSRIEPRPRASNRVWIAVGLLAAASSFVILITHHAARTVSEAPQMAATLRANRSWNPTSLGVSVAVRIQRPSMRAVRHTGRPAQRIAPSAGELAWQARAIPALPVPEPIILDEIQPEPLEVRPLDMTPLSVPAIDEADTGL